MSYNHSFVRGSPYYRAYATAYQGRATITRAYLVRYMQFARSVLFVNPAYNVAELSCRLGEDAAATVTDHR